MEHFGSRNEGQPTYTTVGSVYNPNATPIQPPTRRGRTNRYQFYNSPPGDLTTGFPPNILASLREASTGSPRATGGIIQYSPLQQNHDRAATPGYDKDPSVLHDLGMAVPGMRSGNVPAPPLLGMAKLEAAAFNVGDADSVNSEDALAARFNVKGLTNLASYPNPMQQTARKALAKARNANIGPARAETASSFSYASSDIARERQPGLFGSTTLATGPGAPQPLTAGPPGQRQYRPSGFEGPIKTYCESSAPSNPFTSTRPQEAAFLPAIHRNFRNDDDFAIDRAEASFKTTAPSARPVTPVLPVMHSSRAGIIERPMSRPQLTVGASMDKIQPLSSLAEIRKLCQLSAPDPAKPRSLPIYDSKGSETIQKYYPDGFPKSFQGLYTNVPLNWTRAHPLDPQTRQPIYKTRSEQRAVVHQRFYAGSSRLEHCNSTGYRDILAGNTLFAFNQATGEQISEQFGRVVSVGRYGDVRYHEMTVDDANDMEEATHAEPLLNLLFLTLLGYSGNGREEKKWCGGFVDADTSLIDTTEGANKSVFTEPDELEEPEEAGPRRPPRRRARRYMRPRRF